MSPLATLVRDRWERELLAPDAWPYTGVSHKLPLERRNEIVEHRNKRSERLSRATKKNKK